MPVRHEDRPLDVSVPFDLLRELFEEGGSNLLVPSKSADFEDLEPRVRRNPVGRLRAGHAAG